MEGGILVASIVFEGAIGAVSSILEGSFILEGSSILGDSFIICASSSTESSVLSPKNNREQDHSDVEKYIILSKEDILEPKELLIFQTGSSDIIDQLGV